MVHRRSNGGVPLREVMAALLAAALLLQGLPVSALAEELAPAEAESVSAGVVAPEAEETEEEREAEGSDVSESVALTGDEAAEGDDEEMAMAATEPEEVIEEEPIAEAAADAIEEAPVLVSMAADRYGFIADYRWADGANWPSNQTPKIASYSSSGCCAYCADYVKYCYGTNNPRSGSIFYDISETRAGDILTVGNQSDGTGHWLVVIDRSGDSLYTAEGNYSGRVRVGWNYTISNGKLAEDGRGFTAGYHYLDDPSPVPVGAEMTSGYDRVLPDGDYAIVLTSTMGGNPYYILDIDGTRVPAANTDNVQIWGETVDPSELPDSDLWHISYSDGFYTITQKGTDMALDVADGSLLGGTNVWMHPRNGSAAQQWAISRNGDGYRLEARCNGFSLDNKDCVLKNNNNVIVWEDYDNVAQRWSFIPVSELCEPCEPVLPDGDYAIVLTSTMGGNPYYILDIDGTRVPAANTDNVQLWSENVDPSELPDSDLWHISYSDGFYTITQKGTDMALDVADGSLVCGTNVWMHPRNGSAAQQWSITRNGDGYRLEARCNGFSLDNKDCVLKNNNNVIVWEDYDNIAQRWSFVPMNRATDVPDARYGLRSKATGHMLEVAGSSLENGANVQVGPDGGSAGQRWDVSRNEATGALRVRNAATGLYLDAAGGDAATVTNAIQYVSADTRNNNWVVEDAGDGWCYVRNLCHCYLEAEASGNVAVDAFDGSDAQKWMLEGRSRVDGAEVTLPYAATPCTGRAITPSPTVTLGGATLSEGEDYEVSYSNNVSVGTATVTVTGVGGYEGEARATFTIVRAGDGWVTLAGGSKGYGRGGKLVTGWLDLDGGKYWFDDQGRMATGWTDLVVDGKEMHYYFRPSGNLARGAWADIDGRKYYFRASGNMATGWADIDGRKYWFDESGQMLTGWQDIDNGAGATNHYYFRPSGSMATGWAEIDGSHFYFRPSGNMATGFTDVTDDAYKRYFDESGRMLTGWQEIGGNTYYFRSSGAMQTGTATIDGKPYRFSDKGVLVG